MFFCVYRGGSILARVELDLAVVRLYLTRIDSYEEVALANKNIQWAELRLAVLKKIISVDLQLQLLSSS